MSPGAPFPPPPGAEADADAGPDAATHAGACILVVEDSETQALLLRRMLERHGFAVRRAATAEAALEEMNGDLPDLVIADYHLPGMNGDEMARQIRMNVRTRAIPVLMLTNAQEREVERQGLESGADAYLPKPADPRLILLRIRALLRGGAAEPASAAGGRARPQVPGTAFRRARLLVVEAGATRRAWLSGLLAQDGYVVEGAAGPEEALARIAAPEAGWDAVLLDALGPDFDGVALCRRLDALRAGAGQFQIVGLAAEETPDPARLAQAFEAGADDLLPASAGPEAIRLRIRAVVRRKLLQDESRRIDAELAERERVLERTRAEAAAAEARAALSDALARANAELEEANRQLLDTQGKLVQAAKMASLGELVAGIAHEINNPLAFILAHQGTVERLLGQIGAIPDQDAPTVALAEKCRQRAQSMTLGLKRIQELVLNLRKFSRQDDGGFQEVDVPEAIGTVIALLTNKLSDRIVVEQRLEAPRFLRCSPALLNQVVMNIVGNAADAIQGQGRIEIETRLDGEHYVIAITDSGPGIPEALRERVFEPFFTTKPVGSGTGLGLAIAYNVVRAHQGTIGVGAAPGGGAAFTIAVPLRRQE